jgi:NAD(P)-dependent dehydrogenase (short-subunit alcohol dehydrogenase family)
MSTSDQRTAIVMAGGNGIGEGIARHLAGVGYKLLLVSNGDGAARVAKDLGCLSFKGSVTRKADIDATVGLALANWDRIDLVVNNTGHPARGELLEITDHSWHEGLDLLLLNVVRMAQAVTPVMQRQGGGAIVNISTYAAEQPDLSFPVSSSLRAALTAWVKLYTDAYARFNIRMNNILPGSMENYQTSADRTAAIPLRRQGKMEELGRVVAFLASADAGYIAGQNIRVDGGLTRAL